MTTSDGVTLRHPSIPIVDAHPRLDIDTISILSSQSDSVQHLSSYVESDDEGKGLVGSNSSRLHDAINQSSSLTSTTYQNQPAAFKKDWTMYLTKTNNGNHNKHRYNNKNNNNQSSSDTSESDHNESSSSISNNDDESEQDIVDDPWTINNVQREYYTKQFKDIQPDITKVISGNIAKEFFERSRLPTSELSQIWNLSDVNHDGALSLAEFCTAMHLVVLRVNGFELPDELPLQLQPYTPLIDLSDSTTILSQTNEQTENWANFKDTKSDLKNSITTNIDDNTTSPKQFMYGPPLADNNRIVAPVPVRLSSTPPPIPPPIVVPTIKPPPPPPPPRAPGRTASVDVPHQPTLPPRTNINDTPQRNIIQTTTNNIHNNNNNNNSSSSSTTTTPYLYNRTRPSIASTPQQSDANFLFGQIRDLLQPDHLQELASIISTPSTTTIENLHIALNQTKTRNSVLKAQLKHWEDQLTDLIDKRISLELQYKLQQQQQQQP
ncbi:unnamed protein product [Rotaria sordida]|uniref:Uncharacterized protein n=1 Tax=Rotaria sordida TaxID=392033 RepID=A0A813TS81_9BILA|nr:unnamed protein product [Rotaria sordida]CAF0813223.1 unnamed protein product [Rotaria sordida]CAF0828426.1 unnamed protein product [Rotaria sordida]CAF3757822.1 unnamed protein product [Rotaria sordida]